MAYFRPVACQKVHAIRDLKLYNGLRQNKHEEIGIG